MSCEFPSQPALNNHYCPLTTKAPPCHSGRDIYIFATEE